MRARLIRAFGGYARMIIRMDTFSISGTEFGVDNYASVTCLCVLKDGSRVLTLDVRGDEMTYRAVADGEDSEWGWTLYPPRFYLLDYVLPVRNSDGDSEVVLTPGDLDDYDVALYMMEHNEVSDLVIRLHGDTEVTIVGSVGLMGEVEAFEIRCKLEMKGD
jgi:hypothetical protein